MPGLRPGDRILPAVATGNSLYHWLPRDEYPGDPAQVYLTTDRRYARVYAADYLDPATLERGGDLYEVKPIGPLFDDPDGAARPGTCFSCRAARVLKVAERKPRVSPIEATQAQAPYLAWTDETPMYTEDGWALPAPEYRALGVTADDLRCLGRWAPHCAIDAWVLRAVAHA